MSRGIPWFASLSVLWVTLVSCLAFSSVGHAASPSNIKLKYDFNKRLLMVAINQDATQDRSDFVKFVEIKKNGAVVSIHTYNSQPEGKSLMYQYKVNAIEEDTLQVVITFNKSGSRTSPLLIVGP